MTRLFEFQKKDRENTPQWLQSESVPEFKVRRFESQEELFAYMQQDEYGSAEELPGICFGYEINKNSDSDFETRFYF